MFHTRKLVLVFAIVLAPVAARAADDPEVEQLFKQLNADDFKTRETARKQLIERGEEAVPQIKALAEKAQDPETRTSVAAILEAIDAQSVTGPSLITLDMKDAPAKDVIDAIARQAKTELAVWPDDVWGQVDKKTLTLKVTRQPFWQVMKDVLPQFGLQLNSHGPGDRLRLMRGTPNHMTGPAHLSGPFMVIATGANESRSIDYGKPDAATNARTHIDVNVYVEPKLRVLAREYNPFIEEFVDDAGHSLVTPGRGAGRHLSHSRDPLFNININVPQVEGRTKRIAKLKGSIRAVLMTKSDRIEVPQITKAKGSSQSKGDWTIKVNDVTADASGAVILNVTILKNVVGAANEESEWKRNVGFDSFTVVDEDGRPLDKQGHSMSGNGKQWDGNFQFRRGRGTGEPAKLVWEFPVEAEEVQIPFEFKDLPLP
jgi:hypothetical protein